MANWARGLSAGLETGYRMGELYQRGAERRALAEEAAKYVPTEGAFGPDLAQNVEQLRGLQAQNPEMAAQYDPAIAELQRRQALTAPDYSLGAQTFGTREEALRAAAPQRAQGLANVYRQFGNIEAADAAEARALQARAAGLQISDLERKEKKAVDFDTGYAELNKQTFETPEAKQAALLDLIERTRGPEARAELESRYTTTERNKMLMQAERFDNEFKQARAKGIKPTLEWYDKQNSSFTLEQDPQNPYRVIQVNTDGSRQVFVDAKNEREFWMQTDARVKPGGWLEMAKYDMDVKNTESLVAYRNAMVKAQQEQGANQITGVQVGFSRDANGNPIQVLSGARFNRKTGELEAVQIPLQQNVVPASMLDPAKIDKQAESLVGTPIDPTNKKGPVHTEASARQAVTDQIFNQFLGTGQGLAPGKLPDAKGTAEAILKAQQTAPSKGLGQQTAAPAVPTPPGERPVREAGESFTQFRDRTIAWDRNRLAYDRYIREQDVKARLQENVLGLQRPLMR